jgi:hypothetical protein
MAEITTLFSNYQVPFPTVEELPANDVSRAGACFFYQGELYTFRADGRVYPACGFVEYSARVVFNNTDEPTTIIKKNNTGSASTPSISRSNVGTYGITVLNKAGYTDQKWIGFISPTVQNGVGLNSLTLTVRGNEFGGGVGYNMNFESRRTTDGNVLEDIGNSATSSTYSIVIRAYL